MLSGRGIGGQLVQAAVDRAAATGEVLVPWCSYARKWLTDRPELSGRVGIDWDYLPGAVGNDGLPGITSPASGGEPAAGG